MARPLPFIAIIAVVAGLVAGVWSLERIFAAERNEATEASRVNRVALQGYAREVLGRRLDSALTDAEPRIRASLGDVLAPNDGLVAWRGDEQLIPRVASAAEDDTLARLAVELLDTFDASNPTDTQSRLHELDLTPGPDGATPLSTPWTQRVDRTLRVLQAVEGGDDGAIETSVRRWLDHRLRFVIRSDTDLASAIAVTGALVDSGRADRQLVASLLRDGLEPTSGERLVGLQRQLLMERARLSAADFDLLAERITAQSRDARIRYDDFVAQAASRPAPIAVPDVDKAAIVAGKWFVRPDGGDTVGVEVDLASLLEDVAIQMRAAELIGAHDRFTAATPDMRVVPLRSLEVVLSSPSFSATRIAATSRYRAKTGLAVITGLLAVALIAMGAMLQDRKRKWIELRAQLVATVSHELRTPLAAIRLMGETLERRVGDHPKARDYPARIVRETDRLAFLVENILSFNRLNRGRWKVDRQSIRLDAVLRTVADRVGEGLGRTIDIEADPIPMRADPDLIELMLTNLVKNATQYCTADIVRLTLIQQRDRIELTDNGVGIEPHQRREIFSEFHRADRTGAKGSGLGLAICRRVMRAHGGDIEVARSSDAGTTFALAFDARAWSD